MKGPTIAVWRRRIGILITSLGLLLFAGNDFIYLRFISDPRNMHAQERLQHARMLGLFWNASFSGSMLLLTLSWFCLGWGRWTGLLVNGAALILALMILGARCGPFGC